MELFGTPKSSMENPSLRVNGHGGSTSRTIIVETYAEDEFGQWAIDEVTGEQGYVDGERSCFWTWDDNEFFWQSRPCEGREVRKRKGKGKGKGKGRSKGTGRAFLGEEQAQDLNGGQKKIVLGGQKEGGKKVFSKGNEGFQKGGFRTYQPEKGAGNDSNPHKFRSKDQKKKGKEGAYPQSGLAWESDDWSSSYWPDDSSTSAAGWSCTRARTAWLASVPLNLANHPTHVVLDLCCTLSIGSRAAIKRFQKHALYYNITTAFCLKSFVFANSETETCFESCIIHFPTAPPCSTTDDMLETGEVPILFSVSQMKNLCTTIELDPKGDKITFPASGLCSSPAEYSTMGHIVLDLTSLPYKPKSRERSAHPKRHVTSALSEQQSSYPAHT